MNTSEHQTHGMQHIMSTTTTVCYTIFTHYAVITALLALLSASVLENVYKNAPKEHEKKTFTYIVARKFIQSTREPCDGLALMFMAKLMCRMLQIHPVTWFHAIFFMGIFVYTRKV